MTETEKKARIRTLQIYRNGRQQLLSDTKTKSADLYLGLHSIKKTEQKNYLDRYLILWMTEHVEIFQGWLKNSTEKRVYQSVFGNSYLKFLEYNNHMFFHMSLAVEMLREYRHILDDMIRTSHSWDQGYDKLCVERKKMEAKFASLRAEMENSNKDNH